MNRVFSAGTGFSVPDGTIVHPVLDPGVLAGSGEAWAGELSLAAGVIPPGVESRIHVHPLVTQATWVLEGRLTLKMKDARAPRPYTLHLSIGQAAVTRPGTFFQLLNPGPEPCRVLYAVSPAFVFETDAEGRVIYNDAIVRDEDWDGLAALCWPHPEETGAESARRQRQAALERLLARR